MTLAFDPGDDFAGVADGQEPVTLTRPGSSTSTPISDALRRSLRRGEIEASGGRYTAGDVAWHLPGAQLGDAPRVGDVIIDAAAGRWTLLEVERATLGSRWRCVGRNLAVVDGLDDYVDIEKATVSKSAGGAEQKQWHLWRGGVAARIQPVETEIRHRHGRQGSEATFRIFLGETLSLDQTHRIRGPDGSTYRIVAVRKRERLDRLPQIEAVRED